MSLWMAIKKLLGYKTLKTMTFEELITVLEPRINYHVGRHRGKIPGFDDDDIRQELLIELWKKLDRVPKDIIKPDYRFTRYFETIFNRRIISIHRAYLVARRPGQYRDGFFYLNDFDNVDL